MVILSEALFISVDGWNSGYWMDEWNFESATVTEEYLQYLPSQLSKINYS